MTMMHSLFTDLSRLKMSAVHLHKKTNGIATFSLFARRLPPNQGYLVAAGVEECVDFAEQFAFSIEDLGYLSTIGFDDQTLHAFGRLRFTGEIRAVPEGRLVFGQEPLLEVRAPMAEALLLETYLVSHMRTQTMLATAAARCRTAADRKMQLGDFSADHAPGVDAALSAARAAGVVGFIGSSNVEASRRYGLPLLDAIPYGDALDLQPFDPVIDGLPAPVITFPVDMENPIDSIRTAISTIRERGLQFSAALSIESCQDLLEMSSMARTLLDASQLHEVRIFTTGDLDEYAIERLARAGAPIDLLGICAWPSAFQNASALSASYELVEYGGLPIAGRPDKDAVLPGRKQVFRGPPEVGDLIAFHDEVAPAETERILEPFVFDGERQRMADQTSDARDRFERDLKWLPDASKRLRHPEPVRVSISRVLQESAYDNSLRAVPPLVAAR